MEVIVLTQSEYMDYEPKVVTRLFKEGLKTLHLRKPDYSTEQMKNFILEIPKEYRKRIVIHSHHELALRYKLKGIHLTEAHRKNKFKLKLKLFYYRLRKSNIHISTTYHSLKALAHSRTKYSYIILSPVFESISKKDYKPSFTMAHVKETLEKTRQKVVAVGGVDEDKINLLTEVGFYGVGLLGAIWNEQYPEQKFKQFLETCKLAERRY